VSKEKHIILGVHIQNRVKQVPDLQKMFTEYGCNIRTRLGLHATSEGSCSPAGLILLDTVGEETQIDALAGKLASHDGIDVQKMVFGHDE
jgi:hypothetical protein